MKYGKREMDDYSSKGGQKARWIRLSQLSELAKNLCNLHLKLDVLGEHLSSAGSLFHRIATRLSSAFLLLPLRSGLVRSTSAVGGGKWLWVQAPSMVVGTPCRGP